MGQMNFNDLVKKAEILVSSNKYDQGISSYLKALEVDPSSTSVRLIVIKLYMKMREFSEGVSQSLILADIFIKGNNPDEALKVYNEFLDISKGDTSKVELIDKRTLSTNLPIIQETVKSALGEIRNRLALAYFKKGDIQKAEETLKEYLRENPDDSQSHSFLGSIYLDQNKFREAVGEYQEVIRISPEKSAMAYESIGEIYYRSKRDPLDIINWYRKAADIYQNNNQLEDLIRVYETILNLNSDDFDTLEKLAEAYIRNSDLSHAIKAYETLASLCMKKGIMDKVITVYEKILNLAPENNEIKSKSTEIYKQVLKNDPGNLTARHKLIQSLLSMGLSGEAVPQFRALAKTYLEKDMFDDSLSMCNKLLEIQSDDAKTYEILGKIYFKKGDKQKALEEFIKSMNFFRQSGELNEVKRVNIEIKQYFPEQKEISFQEARSLYDEGKFEDAQHILEEIIISDPHHFDVLQLLTEVYKKQNKQLEILSTYQKLLQLNPKDTKAREEIIAYYFKFDRIEDGIRESVYLGDIYSDSGKLKEAETLYKNILIFFPNNVDVRARLSEIFIKNNLTDKATEELLLIINNCIKNFDIQSAMDYCNKIMSYSSGNINIHHKLANLAVQSELSEIASQQYAYLSDFYLSKNLTEEARGYLNRLLEIKPEEINYREKLLEITEVKGNEEFLVNQYLMLLNGYLIKKLKKEALATYEKILNIDRNNIDIRTKASQFFLENGFDSEALDILEDNLKIYESTKDYDNCFRTNKVIMRIFHDQEKYSLFIDFKENNAKWKMEQNDIQGSSTEYRDIFIKALEHKLVEKAGSVLPMLIETLQKISLDKAVEELEILVREFNQKNESDYELMILDKLVSLYEKAEFFDRLVDSYKWIIGYYEKKKDHVKILEYTDILLSLYSRLERKVELKNLLFIKMETLLALSKTEKAEGVINELKGFTDENELNEKAGRIYFDYKYFNEAIIYYRNMLKFDPENMEILSKLAIIDIRVGKLSEAVDMVKQVYIKYKNFNVIDEYVKAATLEFDEIRLKYNLGMLFRELGFYEEAVGFFLGISDIKECSLSSRKEIASIFLHQGFIDLAIKQYYSILNIKGFEEEDYLDVRYDLAKLLEKESKFKEALNNYNECYAVDISYKDVSDCIERVNDLLKK